MEIRGELAQDGFLICPSTDVRLCSVCHRDIKILRVWVQTPGCDPQLSLRAMTVGCRSPGRAGGLSVGLVTPGPRPHSADGYRCPGWPRRRVTAATAIDAPQPGQEALPSTSLGVPAIRLSVTQGLHEPAFGSGRDDTRRLPW